MEFTHLKKTYPTSSFERVCDGYIYFIDNTTENQRIEWGIDVNKMKKTIMVNEKYIYQVGKENGKFKTVYSSFENFALIRKYIYGVKDEI